MEREMNQKTGKFNQYLATIIVNLSTLSFCTTIGWTSPTEKLLTSDESPMGKLTENEFSWLNSILFIGGLVGPCFWGHFIDRFGCKKTGYALISLMLVGWIILIVFPYFSLALISRFISGVGGACCFVLWPTYITEISSDDLRGDLSAYIMFLNNLGILLVYVLGAFLSYNWLNITCFAICLISLIFFWFMPESPEYLWKESRREEAEEALVWLRGGNRRIAKKELLDRAKLRESSKPCTFSDLIKNKANIRAMVAGHGVFAGQQFCGIIAILTYAASIFEASGVHVNADISAIIAGTAQFIGSYFSTLMVGRFKRKALLISSFALMAISLIIISIYFFLLHRGYNVSTFSMITVVCVCIHLLAYGYGAGPVPYNTISESLAPEIRALATSTMIFSATFLVFFTVKIVVTLKEWSGYEGCFLFFGVLTAFFIIFTWLWVPETFQRPLDEVLTELNGGKPPISKKLEEGCAEEHEKADGVETLGYQSGLLAHQSM